MQRPRPSSYYKNEVGRIPAETHSCGKHKGLTWTGDAMCPACQEEHETLMNVLRNKLIAAQGKGGGAEGIRCPESNGTHPCTRFLGHDGNCEWEDV